MTLGGNFACGTALSDVGTLGIAERAECVLRSGTSSMIVCHRTLSIGNGAGPVGGEEGYGCDSLGLLGATRGARGALLADAAANSGRSTAIGGGIVSASRSSSCVLSGVSSHEAWRSAWGEAAATLKMAALSWLPVAE
eukprot:CAMPEP_0175955884 /NCGR_PEP_ID=MMETSP0108-20121206/32748_1 /TAXON_ID=195067 ORGANISM="Goniomonas pacifica, Strain CCMP1869" /NCGR_SAMPLE_ID=MMETSP0108 /ASSEMBLY_ACC=CAM_ASM_000204 /LENGTH=137 /DNA_ID=CAMNT_0017282793 /DNA_START=28 /DNA_END=438 /DNA_ORIENTATION=+